MMCETEKDTEKVQSVYLPFTIGSITKIKIIIIIIIKRKKFDINIQEELLTTLLTSH